MLGEASMYANGQLRSICPSAFIEASPLGTAGTSAALPSTMIRILIMY
jgi:hypothetical protein